MRSCKNCLFWLPSSKPPHGWCRRRAPIITSSSTIGHQPKTVAYEWCGEFEPKPSPQQPEDRTEWQRHAAGAARPTSDTAST